MLHLNVDDLIFLSNAKGKLLLLGAWRAHKDDALRTARRISVLKLQNAVDLLDDTHLRLAALKLGDEATADILNTSDLQVVLKNGVAGDSRTLLLILNAAEARLDLLAGKVAHDGVKRGLILLVKQDELIRNDTHLLQSNSLGLGTRETFNNPALLAGFHLFNLLAHKFDDDLIAHVTVGLERLLDVFTILLVLLSDLARDQIANRDALEVFAFLAKVSSQAQSDLLALAARGSDEDDARSYTNKVKLSLEQFIFKSLLLSWFHNIALMHLLSGFSNLSIRYLTGSSGLLTIRERSMSSKVS